MTIFWIILGILVWLIGAVIIYMFGVRMDEDYPWNWTNDKRGQLVFLALFSWVCIGLFVIIGLVVLSCMGVAWLANRYFVPILKKLEPKVDKK